MPNIDGAEGAPNIDGAADASADAPGLPSGDAAVTSSNVPRPSREDALGLSKDVPKPSSNDAPVALDELTAWLSSPEAGVPNTSSSGDVA